MDIHKSPVSLQTLTEAAKVAKEVIPETLSETDSALSTMVGWFNNFVLYPVKKANITYRYKLECFEDDLRKKVAQIPENQICEPKLSIAGPTLEALKYTYDEQELREMYVNLLASSMNTQKVDMAHPSFVEIIKRMDSIDAKLFKTFSKSKEYYQVISPKISLSKENRFFPGAAPEFFFGWTVSDSDIFQISTSFIRLVKLGIVEYEKDSHSGEPSGYELLKQSKFLLEILYEYQRKNPSVEIAITAKNSDFYINEYGQKFAICCL